LKLGAANGQKRSFARGKFGPVLAQVEIGFEILGDSGFGLASIAVGTACILHDNQLRGLIKGLKNNLESARAEEAKNKEDLFN